MADGFQIQQQLNQALDANKRAIDDCRDAAQQYASANFDYRKKVAMKMTELRDAKYPASMCKDLARGTDEVAMAEYEMVLADAMLSVCKEQIQERKREVDILRDVYDREFSYQGRGMQ